MELTIITPSGVLCNAQVEKASFPGTKGAFTVLSNHAALVSTLGKGKIQYEVKGEAVEKEMDIERGMVEVKQNKIQVFIE